MRKLSDRTRRRLALIVSLLSIVTLTGFQTGCDAETFRYLCPQLKKYTPEFQAKVADELKNAGPATKQLLSDYGQLRDACRALEASK